MEKMFKTGVGVPTPAWRNEIVDVRVVCVYRNCKFMSIQVYLQTLDNRKLRHCRACNEQQLLSGFVQFYSQSSTDVAATNNDGTWHLAFAILLIRHFQSVAPESIRKRYRSGIAVHHPIRRSQKCQDCGKQDVIREFLSYDARLQRNKNQ